MATTDLELDPDTHDLVVRDGELQIQRDEGEVVTQRIRTRLRTWCGEWFLDAAFGVDYFGKILIKAPSLEQVLAEVREQIEAVPGVRRIVQLDVDYDAAGRILRITDGVVETDAGLVTLEA